MFLDNVLKKIPKQDLSAFFGAVVFGLITHIQTLVLGLFNHDSLQYFENDFAWLLSQGKWFAGTIVRVTGGPTVSNASSVVVGMLLLALASVLTVKTLKVKSCFIAAAIGAIIATYPSVTAAALYFSNAYFAGVFFLAALAAYLTVSYKWGGVFGAVALTLSIGGYQAYVGYSISLMLAVLIIDSMQQNKDLKGLIAQAVKYASVVVSALISYYLILLAILKITNTSLGGYMGVNRIVAKDYFAVGALVDIFWQTYGGFFAFLFNYNRQFSFPFKSLHFLTAVLIILFLVYLIDSYKTYKNKPVFVFALFLIIIILPIAPFAIKILAMFPAIHDITNYSSVFIFVFFAYLCDLFMVEFASESNYTELFLKKVLSIVAAVVLSFLVFNWYLLATTVYNKMNIANRIVTAQFTSLIGSIYDTREYTVNMPIALVGLIGINPYSFLGSSDTNYIFEESGVTGSLTAQQMFFEEKHTKKMLATHLGLQASFVNSQGFYEDNQELCDEMGIYPEKNSIKLVDGVMVIKLSQTYKEQ